MVQSVRWVAKKGAILLGRVETGFQGKFALWFNVKRSMNAQKDQRAIKGDSAACRAAYSLEHVLNSHRSPRTEDRVNTSRTQVVRCGESKQLIPYALRFSP